MKHVAGCICVECEDEVAAAKQRIAELEAQIKKLELQQIRDFESSLTTRRKVAEDCIITASEFITTKWRRQSMAEAIRAKYLKA